jgi:hypothetical protein
MRTAKRIPDFLENLFDFYLLEIADLVCFLVLMHTDGNTAFFDIFVVIEVRRNRYVICVCSVLWNYRKTRVPDR